MVAKNNAELENAFKKDRKRKLIYSIAIDSLGMISYLFPGVGEALDIAWAPISVFLVMKLYPNRKKQALMNGLEEIMPYMDIFPTALLTWRLEYVKDKEVTFLRFAELEAIKDENFDDYEIYEDDKKNML